jgi:arsenate reductase
MPTPVTIHGIRNCDTMKKARAWLEAHGVAHAFHDYKVAGIDRATLGSWVSRLGWERLLNRAGTTFRKLPEAQKQDLTESRAIELMLAQPSMIRRPVLGLGDRLIVGFDPGEYESALAALPRD